MRILVTGGAGYIGSITTRVLIDAGHEVTVLDTLERGHRDAVDARARFVQGDVGDRDVLDRELPACDAVMHLAGYTQVEESQADPERYFLNNARKPRALLEACIAAEVGSVVFSSTAAVYGEPVTVPITEDAPTEPVNAYGTSKLMFERTLEQFAASHGLRAVRLRYFNVAGAWPGGSMGEDHRPETHIIPRVLSAMAQGQRSFAVFGDDYPTPDGTCVRDYIHVLDLAEAHRLSLERLYGGGEGGVFNLGSGRGYSNLEVVRACARVSGRDVVIDVGPRRAGDPPRLVASSERARDELGWTPARGELDTIIADAWAWHSAHPRGYGRCPE